MTATANNLEIAKTIISQIKMIDRMATWAWGMDQVVAIENGVQFKASGSKCKRGGKIVIKLNGLDLYDISLIRVRGAKVTKLDSLDDCYAEMLVNVIDGFLG